MPLCCDELPEPARRKVSSKVIGPDQPASGSGRKKQFGAQGCFYGSVLIHDVDRFRGDSGSQDEPRKTICVPSGDQSGEAEGASALPSVNCMMAPRRKFYDEHLPILHCGYSQRRSVCHRATSTNTHR